MRGRVWPNVVDDVGRRLARAADRSGDWAAEGYRNPGTWLSSHTGERRSVCSRRIRDARQLTDMPAAATAAAAGFLPDGHVRLLCDARRAAPDRYDTATDEAFTAVATAAAYDDLVSAVREWKRRAEAEASPDPTQVDPGDDRQVLAMHQTLDGWWDGTFHLGPADGELVHALIDGEVDRYLRAARDGDPAFTNLSMGVLRARALVDGLTRTTRREPGRHSAPDRFRVGVILPADGTIPAWATCDTELYRIVAGAPSEPLDIGRTTRRWTAAQRRAVVHRDRLCTFPRCDRPPSQCDIHHCLGWDHGGPTELANAALLCGHHHRFLHAKGWTARVVAGEVVIMRPDGTPHVLHSCRPRPPNGAGRREEGRTP